LSQLFRPLRISQ